MPPQDRSGRHRKGTPGMILQEDSGDRASCDETGRAKRELDGIPCRVSTEEALRTLPKANACAGTAPAGPRELPWVGSGLSYYRNPKRFVDTCLKAFGPVARF